MTPAASSGLAVLVALAAIALVLMLAPPGWRAALAVGVAALLHAWWLSTRLDRARRRDLETIADAIPGDTPQSQPPTLGAIVEQLGRLRLDEQRRGDQARREQTALGSILDAAALPILTTDSRGKIDRINTPCATLIGTTASDLIGRGLDEVFTHNDILEACERARAGSPAKRSVRVPVDGQPRWFDASAAPLPPTAQSERGAILLMLTDVTELATAVQLKTDFAANASHELRTPIAVIRGAVETMEAADDDPEALIRMRGIIASNVRRLEAMLSDLLDLSRLESQESSPPRAVPVDAHALTLELAGQISGPCIERDITLDLDLQPELARMLTDPSLLELILRNLIDNAVKFAKPATTVRVVGRVVEIARPAARNPGESPLAGARFRIIDKGVGIPLRDQQRIFERFYQIDPSRDAQSRTRGTGLGLAIVKHALRRLGGNITVESIWQQGTTMTVEIPRCVQIENDAGAAIES